ncbi:MAG TPA: hypothetical protein VMW91_02255 [Desulfosporosinus sp.]|nr:hypothetical protein [Desulfosporosinus sp.]
MNYPCWAFIRDDNTAIIIEADSLKEAFETYENDWYPNDNSIRIVPIVGSAITE